MNNTNQSEQPSTCWVCPELPKIKIPTKLSILQHKQKKLNKKKHKSKASCGKQCTAVKVKKATATKHHSVPVQDPPAMTAVLVSPGTVSSNSQESKPISLAFDVVEL